MLQMEVEARKSFPELDPVPKKPEESGQRLTRGEKISRKIDGVR